jgi:hypothetical protein
MDQKKSDGFLFYTGITVKKNCDVLVCFFLEAILAKMKNHLYKRVRTFCFDIWMGEAPMVGMYNVVHIGHFTHNH